MNTSFKFSRDDTEQVPEITNSSYLWMSDPISLEEGIGFGVMKDLEGAITSAFEKLEKYAPRWVRLWGSQAIVYTCTTAMLCNVQYRKYG